MRIALLVVVVGAALLVGGLVLAGAPGTLGSVGMGMAMAGIAGLAVSLVYSDATATRKAARGVSGVSGAGGAAASGEPGSDAPADRRQATDHGG